jgi:hypothetical protein
MIRRRIFWNRQDLMRSVVSEWICCQEVSGKGVERRAVEEQQSPRQLLFKCCFQVICNQATLHPRCEENSRTFVNLRGSLEPQLGLSRRLTSSEFN